MESSIADEEDSQYSSNFAAGCRNEYESTGIEYFAKVHSGSELKPETFHLVSDGSTHLSSILGIQSKKSEQWVWKFGSTYPMASQCIANSARADFNVRVIIPSSSVVPCGHRKAQQRG